MLLRVNKLAAKQTSGMPRCSVAVSAGRNAMDAPAITAFIQAYDAYDIGSVPVVLHMNPDEAKDLGERLIAAAEKARALGG